MESTSTSSRFRFRDHQEMENSTQSDTSSEISSVSSDQDDESELQSMTGKGIKRLCSELLELKAASDEDFIRNIFSNYSAFVRIFEEVGGMENELMQLKNHVSSQKKLVKELIDGIYLKALSEETIESIIQESFCAEPLPLSNLEAHTNDVSETLDILLSENRIDEALTILELEDEYFQRMQFKEIIPPEELMFHSSAISERKAMLTLQLTLVAENPRVAAPELQKALVGLCRLGDSHLATQLLLEYYHSRIATGIHNLQCSKSFLQAVYIKELAKFVFSMISQAARSFIMLYGETSPYASELIQWACEETEVFVACFNKYVKSISEISGGLSTAVESLQFALSYCSLLESQRLVLRPCLIKLIRPCMEEVLQIHIDHFKKVIGIFTATDAWVLGRYLVSGILNDGCSTMVIGQQLEYCLLTNSGRKFVTLLQSIAEDITPLVALQMEGSVLRGLMNLFAEYAFILERAITCETNVTEKGGSRINLAESLQQQVSVLANISTLEHFFSSILRSIFEDISLTESELMINHSVGNHQKELDSCILYSQKTSGRLRAHLCQQFTYRMMSLETDGKITQETCIDVLSDPSMSNYVTPSVAFQVLFLELRKLENLAQDNVFEVNWLMELLRELIEALFVWISNNKEIWATNEEKLTVQHSDNFKQFVLDMHFLVEIASYGGYFSNNPLVLVTLMKSAFLSTGLDPKRDAYDDRWARNAATEAVQKLLEIKNIKSPPNEEPSGILEEEPNGKQSEYASESPEDDARSSLDDSIVSEEDLVAIDASEVAVHTDPVILNAEFGPLGESFDPLEGEDGSDGRSALTDSSVELEDFESEKVASEAYDETWINEKTNSPVTLLSKGIVGEASETRVPIEERVSSEPDVSEAVTNKLEDGADKEFPGTKAASTEDSVGTQG